MRVARFALIASGACVVVTACGLNSTGGSAIDGGLGSAGATPTGAAGGPSASGGGPITSGGSGVGGNGAAGAVAMASGNAGATTAGGAPAGAGGGSPMGCTPTSCIASQYCGDAGQCVPKIPGGSVCANDVQCSAAAPYCIGDDGKGNGRCCNEKACGQCHSCSSGVCKVLPSDPTCLTGDGTNPCAGNNACDDSGCVQSAPQGTSCGDTLVCYMGSISSSESCDGEGNCNEPQIMPTSCAPYICQGDSTAGKCLTACDPTHPNNGDSDCSDGNVCIDDVCRNPLQPGENCAGNETRCQTGQCSLENVCCDSKCDSPCQTCVSTNGICSNAGPGANPHGACAAGPDGCTTAGCNGTSAACPPPLLHDGDVCSQDCTFTTDKINKCSGGECKFDSVTAGCTDGFACSGTFGGSCYTSCSDDGHCATGSACDVPSGKCVQAYSVATGSPCGADDVCRTGHCVASANGGRVCSVSTCVPMTGGSGFPAPPDECAPSGVATPSGTDCVFPTACCVPGPGNAIGACVGNGTGSATCAPTSQTCGTQMCKQGACQ